MDGQTDRWIDGTYSSCSAGVCTKLPLVISLNPDLTKDLDGQRIHVVTV